MVTFDEPYFMKNKEWYRFNEDKFRYELTDKAPEKAKQSYEEFYSEDSDNERLY